MLRTTIPLLTALRLVSAFSFTTLTGNILPTQFPVTAFPESTQTHFDSPSCTNAPKNEQSLTNNYNFETVERAFPLTALTPIGVYNLLNFVNINHVNTDPDFDGNHLGLAPYTYPNAATFTFLTTLEDQLFHPFQGPMITANYTESIIKSFTPHSFWYGCVLPSPYTAGSFPTDCTITAKGYDYNGKGVPGATQTWNFARNGSIIQDQLQAKFNDAFQNIYTLAFDVGGGPQNAALIDNFIATVTQDACAPFYTGSYKNEA